MREAMGYIGGDRPLPLDDLIDAAGWYSDIFGEVPDAYSFRS
jgi:hypothetical protein